MTRKAWFLPLPPATFPHADGEWLRDAPPACRRCGGPWHRVEEGYACLLCGKRWRVAECLRDMAWRDHLDTDSA